MWYCELCFSYSSFPVCRQLGFASHTQQVKKDHDYWPTNCTCDTGVIRTKSIVLVMGTDQCSCRQNQYVSLSAYICPIASERSFLIFPRRGAEAQMTYILRTCVRATSDGCLGWTLTLNVETSQNTSSHWYVVWLISCRYFPSSRLPSAGFHCRVWAHKIKIMCPNLILGCAHIA